MSSVSRRAAAVAFIGQALTKNKAWASLPYAYDYTPGGNMSYFGWFDDNPKKTTAQKIDEAIAAYIARYQVSPTIVLVNEAERVEVKGMDVRSESYIRKSNFWVGMVEA